MQRIEKTQEDGEVNAQTSHKFNKREQFGRSLHGAQRNQKVSTYEEATAKIANAEQIKTLI